MIRKSICFSTMVFLLSLQSLYSVTTTEVFRSHLKRVFVETGSIQGDGVQKALDAGFEEVYSIELAPHLYEHCCERFKNNPHVHLFLGDSSEGLKVILKKINEPVTFWLDGHYSWGETARGESNTPLLKELEIIANQPIKTHTILIDDVRCFGTTEFDDIDKNTIVKKLLAINSHYTLSYEDGYQKNDVLVAEVAE